MGRSPARDEASAAGVKKGPWTPEEDQKLAEYVEKHGRGSWQRIPKLAGLNRCGKSCRLRWTNYLRPDIKRGKFTDEEEQLIIRLHSLLGNKWSSMATKLPGRTDNEIKNYWNTHLRKKLLRMGIDPVTHRPAPANLTLLSGLLSPGASATHLNGTLNLQADVAHLLKLQLLQSILQLLAGSNANATAAAAAAAIAVAPNANLLNLQSSIPPGSSNLSTNRFSLDEEGVSAEISSTGSFPAAAAAAAAEAEAPAPAANSCTDAAGDGWEDCDFWKDIIDQMAWLDES